MNTQDSLFSAEDAPIAPEVLAQVGIKVLPMGSQKLSAAQRLFNKQVSDIEALSLRKEELAQWLGKHAAAHRQKLRAAVEEQHLLRKKMLLRLHERLQQKGLSISLARTAKEIVQDWLEDLNAETDLDLKNLIAQYFAAHEDESSTEMDALLQQHLDESLQEILGKAAAAQVLRPDMSPAEKVAATEAYVEAKESARLDKLAEKRQARKEAKLTPVQKEKLAALEAAKAQGAQDAKNVLRQIYRQLASSLHPDREPDEAKRLEKTKLMSEANAAYERQDLSTLLRLQLQLAQIEPEHMAKMADDKLKAMSTLLREQLKALNAEMSVLQDQAVHAFGVDHAFVHRMNEAQLLGHLHQRYQAYASNLSGMQADYDSTANDAALKNWLKEQRDQRKAEARAQRELQKLMQGSMRGHYAYY
jgi:hypothetical protein